MEKSILAISDIHGCFDQFKDLLDKVDYDSSKHQLVLLGDYIDRGQKSKEVIELVMKLVEDGAIALRGNHDQMLLDFLLNDNSVSHQLYLQNGGLSTIESYVGYNWFEDGITFNSLLKAKKFIKENFKEHITFLYELPYYHKTEEFLFVHAGIDPSLDNWKDTSKDDMLWIREGFFNAECKHDFTVIHGHTPCLYLHNSHHIDFSYRRIGIDGACAYSGQLNCLEINSGSFEAHYIDNQQAINI